MVTAAAVRAISARGANRRMDVILGGVLWEARALIRKSCSGSDGGLVSSELSAKLWVGFGGLCLYTQRMDCEAREVRQSSVSVESTDIIHNSDYSAGLSCERSHLEIS